MEEFVSNWLFWLILAALMTVIELLTNTFAFFCLVGGCLVALIVEILGFGLEAQLLGAAIGSVVAFIAFLPLMRKHRAEQQSGTSPSNMDALIGRTTVVVQPVEAGKMGRAKIDGDNWQIRSADNSAINAGEQVRVVGYDSIILTVERI